MRVKFPSGQRLVYADKTSATKQFWEEHWGELDASTFALADKGYLQWLERPFLAHLPKTGKILEAGCGPGQVLRAMQVRGYDAEGVEWAADLVGKVNQFRPDIPIRAGDATALSVPEGSYSAVVSLGVAEHRQEGPEPFIAEAHRILSPNGVLLMSVPHFHALRKLRYGKAQPDAEGSRFYQYAFTPEEFSTLLEKQGFAVKAQYGYAFWESLREDFPFIRPLERLPLIGKRLQGLFNRASWLSRRAGHMALFYAVKRPAAAAMAN